MQNKTQFEKIRENSNFLFSEILGRVRNVDGTMDHIGYPNADTAGISLPLILQSITAGLTSDELTPSIRAAMLGLSIGIRLGRDKQLEGYPLEAGLRDFELK